MVKNRIKIFVILLVFLLLVFMLIFVRQDVDPGREGLGSPLRTTQINLEKKSRYENRDISIAAVDSCGDERYQSGWPFLTIDTEYSGWCGFTYDTKIYPVSIFVNVFISGVVGVIAYIFISRSKEDGK